MIPLSIGVQHDVDDECIGHADIFAFLEPLRLDFLRRLVWQDHERIFHALAYGSGGRKHYINVSCRPLVAMCGEGVSANQQVIDAVRIERTEQHLQIFKCRWTSDLFGHGCAL